MLKFFDKSLLRIAEELSINAKSFDRPRMNGKLTTFVMSPELVE